MTATLKWLLAVTLLNAQRLSKIWPSNIFLNKADPTQKSCIQTPMALGFCLKVSFWRAHCFLTGWAQFSETQNSGLIMCCQGIQKIFNNISTLNLFCSGSSTWSLLSHHQGAKGVVVRIQANLTSSIFALLLCSKLTSQIMLGLLRTFNLPNNQCA